jgi:hypothetical protein
VSIAAYSDNGISLRDIRTDGGTQARAGIDKTTVDAYAADMKAGANFPPVVVFHDGADYWLADGFHRVAAAKSLNHGGIACDIRQGTRHDAILYACGANSTNGLRRTNADKRRAVEVLLADEEWSKRSDRWIADKCGVTDKTVAKLRPSTAEIPQLKKPRTGQDGKVRGERKKKGTTKPKKESTVTEEQEEDQAKPPVTICDKESHTATAPVTPQEPIVPQDPPPSIPSLAESRAETPCRKFYLQSLRTWTDTMNRVLGACKVAEVEMMVDLWDEMTGEHKAMFLESIGAKLR